MRNWTWDEITADLNLAAQIEGVVHPHDIRDCAGLFHVRDNSGSTEYEFLNLLHAFVLAMKPARVIETGTFTGMGTVAIAHAMKMNGVGRLWTVDLEDCTEAKQHIHDYELGLCTEFVRSDSADFCARYLGEPFDLAFIDSGEGRLKETLTLIERGMLREGALVLVHDAGPYRQNFSSSWKEAFDGGCPLHANTLPLSRGLRIMFV